MLFNLSPQKLINGFKTALACLIGYLLYLFSPLPQAQWILITILVVMSAQTSVGSLFIKAKYRFLGTVCGALAAILIIFICGQNHIALGVALFVMFMIFTYIASSPGDVSYMGTLGSVTIATIILNSGASIMVAGERFTEIVLGICVAFLVSYFIFPIRSHTLFVKNLSTALHYLHEYFEHCFQDPVENDQELLLDVDEKMFGIFAQQRRLIYETGWEFGKSRKDKSIFKQIFNVERRIYRAINLMYYSLHATPESRRIIQSLQGFEKLRLKISDFLEQLSHLVKTGSMQEIEFLIADLTNEMENDFKQSLHAQDYVNAVNTHTFFFGAKFILRELKVLTESVGKISYLRK